MRAAAGRAARRTLAAIALAATLGATGLAQEQHRYPIFTADHLHEAMRLVGLGFGLTRTAIGAGDYTLGKDYLSRARDQLATTITFWRDRQTEDAITILRSTLKQMDALDAAMSADAVDASAVAGLAKEVGGSCQSCHARYREQDPATKAYRVKAEFLR